MLYQKSFLQNTIKVLIITIFCLFTMQVQAVNWTIKSLTKIVNNQVMRPGSHDFFTHFDPPCLYDGKMVFRGFNGRRYAGVYSTLDGGLSVIMNTKTKLPISPTAKKRFRSFGDNNFPGSPSFPMLLKDSIVFFGNGYGNGLNGVYYVSDNQISVIANQKTIIPGGAKGLFTYFIDPGFTGKHHVIFIGKGKEEVIGIYRGSEKELEVLVDNTTPTPDNKDNTFKLFSQLSSARNSDSNDFAFLGTDDKNHVGLYFYQKGKLFSIVNDNTVIPEGTGYFKSIENIVFDDKTSQVVFVGRGILGQVGIYSYHKGKITKIVDQQTTMPEESDKFNNFFTMSIDDGKIIFEAVGHKKHPAIFLYTKDGLFRVISKYDTVNKKELKAITFSKVSYNKDQLALSVEFKDGENAIYLLTLEHT